MIFPTNRTIMDGKFSRIIYLGNASNRIGNFLKKQGHRPVFYTNGSIASVLCNNRDVTDKLKRCGVYSLKCADCNAIYVGQTGRSFNVRCKEHTNITPSNISKSNFANHLHETGHTFVMGGLEILHTEKKGRRLNALEILEINREILNPNSQLLNDQLSHRVSPLLEPLNCL